jgi:hypothetical protein
MDSKFQFRNASLPPTAGTCIRGLTGSSSPRKQLYPFAETDNHSDDSAALTSNDPNPTEASTPVTILRGTEISNPFPSSKESPANLIKGEIERPSDFDGVVYISLVDADWQMRLDRELQAAGYKIDWNKAMR